MTPPKFSLFDTVKSKNSNNNNQYDTVIYRYDFDSEWTTKSISHMFVGRQTFVSVLVNNSEIITFGGCNLNGHNSNNSKILDDVESYDINNNKLKSSTWTKLCSMPIALCNHAAINVDNKNIYVLGGLKPGYKGIALGFTQSSVFKYSVSNNRWEGCMSSMNIKRDGLASVVVDGKIYAIGGRSFTVEVHDTTTSTSSTASSNKWVLLPSKMNTKRYGCCAVAMNKVIYVIGGKDEDSNILNTIEIYDTLSETSSEWVQLSSTMNEKRFMATAVALENFILVAGGRSTDSLDSIEIFDTKTNQFITSSNNKGNKKIINVFPSMTSRRGGCSAVLVEGSSSSPVTNSTDSNNETFSTKNYKIVVCGGHDGNRSLDTVETINIQTVAIPMSQLNLPSDVIKEISSFLVQ